MDKSFSIPHENLCFSDFFKKYRKRPVTYNGLTIYVPVIYRNSCSHMFFKIGVLENFANFTEKHLCWSLFLIELQVGRSTPPYLRGVIFELSQIVNSLHSVVNDFHKVLYNTCFTCIAAALFTLFQFWKNLWIIVCTELVMNITLI